MTINVGDLVRCVQTGSQVWVARAPDPNGRWLLVSKGVDRRGRATFSGRQAGEGDLTVIKPAPVYSVGAELQYNDMTHIVLRDNGDGFVELGVPEHRTPTKGTEFVRIPSGNVTEVAKSDLVLATL